MVSAAQDRRSLHLGLVFGPQHGRSSGTASFSGVAAEITAAVRAAEAATLDFVLFDDSLSASAQQLSTAWGVDPFSAAAHAAVNSSRIGLIASADPLHHEPFNLARLIASLDHISAGRAGWYVSAGHDGGSAAAPDRVSEFVCVAKQLWHSWGDGAFIRDKATGRFVDAEKIHAIDYTGTYFAVKGPLNLARPPQGQPVLARHGGEEGWIPSEVGAELVFTSAADTPADGESSGELILRHLMVLGPTDVAAIPGLDDWVAGDGHRRAAFDKGKRVAGDPRAMADLIEQEFTAGVVDGYLLHTPAVSEQLHWFAERVVPLLRERGLFRRGYTGSTLRSHLRPPHPRPDRIALRTTVNSAR